VTLTSPMAPSEVAYARYPSSSSTTWIKWKDAQKIINNAQARPAIAVSESAAFIFHFANAIWVSHVSATWSVVRCSGSDVGWYLSKRSIEMQCQSRNENGPGS
jgi:hypothetical protein